MISFQCELRHGAVAGTTVNLSSSTPQIIAYVVTLETISSAATIALASATVFLLIVKSWRLIAQPFANKRNFGEFIMVESAQRFRDRLRDLNNQQTLALALTLMFVLTFGIAVLLSAQNFLGKLPFWQNVVVLIAVSFVAGYGLYKLVVIIMERRNVAFVRDANVAVGHGLQRLTASQNRIFHEVRCASGIIDNVVVGLQGIYIVNVIAQRPFKDNRVRLTGDELSFAPGKINISLAENGVKARQLAKQLKLELGHDVRVRPVVAVPGWEIDAQASENYLVVNERTIAMLRGWRDENDYLMTEDVEAINQLLTSGGTQTSRSQS